MRMTSRQEQFKKHLEDVKAQKEEENFMRRSLSELRTSTVLRNA